MAYNLTNTLNTVNLPVFDVDDVTNEDVIDEFERKLSAVDSSNVADSSINMNLKNPYDFDLEIVRDFVNNLGQEFVFVFDSMWCSGNEERLEIIAEMKMNQKVKKL